MSTTYDIREIEQMTHTQQAKHDCRQARRKVWTGMILCVALIVVWGALMHSFHRNGRAAQHVDDTR